MPPRPIHPESHYGKRRRESTVTQPALQHLRFPVSASRGRRYPELTHPYRDEFQRDRDRVVHARAFRRLENKTQVFAPSLSDHFRNRLTHTIEVSQIARTAAAALGLNEGLTEALSLAHDIGHPPFAHAGETQLDLLMREHGEHFDHNLHALRIVETFEKPYARFPGLNLTFEVREGIVKHSRDFGPGEFPALEEYLPGQKPPLEAQLIDLCDEIAYNTADLDDAYSAGLIQPEQAAEQVPQFAAFLEIAEGHFPGAPEAVRMKEIVRMLINWLMSGLMQGTMEAAAGLNDVEAIRRHPKRVAQFTDTAAATSIQLKSYLRKTVYESPELEAARGNSLERIARLFHFFMENPSQMPAAYRAESSGQPPHRQVCDYIAGMTDRFFLKTCDRLGIG